jgi:hypothetical protein
MVAGCLTCSMLQLMIYLCAIATVQGDGGTAARCHPGCED